MKPSVCIIGGGVVGLTCADVLSDDFEVTVVAEQIGLTSASIVATAIWHVYLVDNTDLATLKWAQETLEKLMEIQQTEPEAGVSLIRGVELFRKSAPHLPTWAEIPPYFELLSDQEVARFISMDPPDNARVLPIRWGYRIEAPAASMEAYLPWLLARIQAKGVRCVERRLPSLEHASEYGSLVVNCSGYGARKLTPESGISPVKGQYLVYVADDGAPVEYYGDDDHPVETSYVIPRSGEVIIGGTEEYDEEDLDFSRTDSELLDRVEPFEPWVARLRGREPLRRVVGLRPFRPTGVRLELTEPPGATPVIHNFGHGGSGFSLSWGCANAVAELARVHFDTRPPGEVP